MDMQRYNNITIIFKFKSNSNERYCHTKHCILHTDKSYVIEHFPQVKQLQ